LKIIGDKGLATPDIQYLTPSQVGGIRSHATSPGKSPGEHTMANGEVSMSSRERGAAGAKASHATSPDKSPGEHTMANGKVSMSSKERMANASAHLTLEDCRKRMLVRPMNGTAHLNPNAEEDFIDHCATAKELFEKVSR